ncbi:MAG: hypothetical protein MZV70_62015 [Desulfobacterales bacterium]|nr:hypothetical protein [Desulfobacterales bacterium]
MMVYHSMGYLPSLAVTSRFHAILKNWIVRRKLPTGMITNTADLGTVTARTSVTLQCNALIHIGNSIVNHDTAGKPAYTKHDNIQVGLGFISEVGIDDVGGDVAALPVKAMLLQGIRSREGHTRSSA